MEARQDAKLTMFRAVEQHCENNRPIINQVAAFKSTFELFKAKIAEILSAIQLSDLSLAGITADKLNCKQNLAQISADIAGIIYVYASVIDNQTLKQEMNTNVTKLSQTRDDQLAPRCQNIHDRGTENLEALNDYGITVEKLAALQTAINEYNAVTPKPRTAVSQRKTHNSNMRRLFKEADEILKDRLDKLVVTFRSGNPDFVTTYESNRIIIDPAVTATQLKGVVTTQADNNPVKNASIAIVGTAAKAVTNSSGEYLIKPAPAGQFTLKITANGFEDSEIEGINIKLGGINTLDLRI